MSGRIGQRLAPGERVVCRLWPPGERRDWRRIAIMTAIVLAAILIAHLFAYFLSEDRLVFGLSIIAGFAGTATLAEDDTSDAAVTDRRLLMVTGANPTLTTVVKPDEIESVEVLRGGLRVGRREGPPVLLIRRRGFAELAAAIAELAGLPPPQPRGPRDLAAARVMLASILTTGYAAGLACLVLVTQHPWMLESKGHVYLAVILMVAAMAIGTLLGPLLGLVLVRGRLTQAEMRTWIEGSAVFAQAMDFGGLCARLACGYGALADRLYGPPSSNGKTGAEHHGE